MRAIFGTICAVFASMSLANTCWAQRGVPAPRPVPAPHAVPVHPVAPHSGGHGGPGSAVDPWVVILIVVVAVAAIAGLVYGIRAWTNRTVAHLRILGLPPGEAPESIRRAWVGVELPLRRGQTEPNRVGSLGVLSRQGPEVSMGYLVDGSAAVAALASQAPEAAAWWRENAPHVIASGYRLFFPSDVCERVG
jgi:hypothetical protein